MKTLIIICFLALTSCARATFTYNGGKLVKEPRLRPSRNYPIAIAFSIGFGEQYKIKH